MAAGAQPIRRDGPDADAAQRISAGSPRLTPLRELQLLEQYRGGGPRAQVALSDLMHAYQRRIYAICRRMVRNHDAAADLTQDATIKVIEGLPSYNGQSKLSTWVIRVAINCCLSHIRKEKLRTHESLDAATAAGAASGEFRRPASSVRKSPHQAGPEPVSGMLESRELSPQRRIEQEQTRAVLLQALESLEPDLRAILVLRDLQDLDYQQLADVLQIPIGTVKSRLFRARAALREQLESQGDF